MRILVILRQVYEQKSIRWDYEKSELKFKKPSLNQSDVHALQWASDVARNTDATVDSLILTNEELDAESIKQLSRFRINKCMEVPKSANELQDAKYISVLIDHGMYDLIMAGDETEDEHNAFLLPYIGHALGLAPLTSVQSIEIQGTEELIAYRKEERGAEQAFRVKLPAALSVTSRITKLRYSRGGSESPEIVRKERKMEQTDSAKRLGPPEPNIIFGSVPNEETAQERLLRIMGFSEGQEGGLSKQVQSISKEHLHFTAERLVKWLKE